ncbi:MAG: DUF4349 domain-containing protein [Halolamina sp.]
MRAKRTLSAVALACLLLLAGCSGGGGAEMAATEAAVESGGDAADREAEATGTPVEESGGSADVQASNRMRIKTAEFRVRVSAFESSRTNLTTAARGYGGYVASSRIRTEERDNETYSDGTIVFRVPAENYSAFLETVRAQGTVVNEEEDVNDVTRRHADLEARLESLRAERDRLRELYEQANDTEDVLRVQRELADVQREIETTEAKLRTLENKVAYSTVTVSLHEERPDREYEEEHWYDTGVITAFLDSVSGVLVTMRALVVGLAYVLPYLLVFGIPAYGVVALVRRLQGGATLPFVGDTGDEADDVGGEE